MTSGSGEQSQVLVSGTVRLDPDAPEIDGATVRVKLRDVTLADAPAGTVAEEVVAPVSLRASGGAIPFELRGPARLVPGHAYLVEAHVDLTGSGEIEPGDFITMESHPVPAGPRPAHVDVRVHRIG